MKSLRDAAIDALLDVEGGFQKHHEDRGNWTSGQIDVGELRGTKFGISAMTYPDVDIENLTREEAASIYARDFWPLVPDDLPPDARWFAFDCAVHHGPARARSWVSADASLAALVSTRIEFMTGLSAWHTFGRGWMRRVASVLFAIRQWQRGEEVEDELACEGEAQELMLDGLRLAERWVALTRSPALLRGTFRYRESRAGDRVRLEVRRS